MRSDLSFAELEAILRGEEVLLGAVVSREEAEAAMHRQAVQHRLWLEWGCAAEMHYMQRPSIETLGAFLPSAQSVLTVLIPYAGDPTPLALPPGFGRVARYAWGRDYHTVIRDRLTRVVSRVRERVPGLEARVFTDAVPLPERAVAASGGLGFRGKNTVLIRPGAGSFFFVAEIVWNITVATGQSDSGANNAVKRSPLRVNDFFASEPVVGCGACTRCRTGCPTGALDTPGVLDARRCISYLTIEKRTPFSAEEAELLGEWIFGCDVCQEVCPYNAAAPERGAPLQEFLPESGVGAALSLFAVLGITSDEEFRARFRGSPLLRAKRGGLVRNACAVVGNTVFVDASPLLRRCAEDSSELIRLSAVAALHRLAPHLDGSEARRVRELLDTAR